MSFQSTNGKLLVMEVLERKRSQNQLAQIVGWLHIDPMMH